MRAVLSILVLCAASMAAAQSYPDYSEIYVNDFADLLSDADEAAIRADLVELRENSGIEFTVVTIDRMADYGHAGAIEPFATGLFNNWGVGDAARNDGLMMLVAAGDRQIRIEVGAGYGSAQDAPMKEIIDDHILPYFRAGDFPTGIDIGVDHVIHQITGIWPGEFDATWGERTVGLVERLIDGLGGWLWAIGAAMLAAPAELYRRWRRNRPRVCPRDRSRMIRLDEQWDDNHLQPGQIKEEALKSVDYDVWECQECGHVTVEGYKAWFSRYGACRQCGYRTVEGDTTILRAATYSSEGLKRIDYHCHHCGAEYSVERTIPRKRKRSSSSSSSFGGGRSSGGGASGSW